MASSTLESYNVWEDVPSTTNSKVTSTDTLSDNNHSLSSIDNDDDDSIVTITTTSSSSSSSRGGSGGSPTRYSVQTIRQKKGRQLLSSMMGGGAGNDSDGNGHSVSVGPFPMGGGSSSVATTSQGEEEEVVDGEDGRRKKTTTTTTTTATTSMSSSSSSGKASSTDAGASPAGGQVEIGGNAPLLGGGGRGSFPSVGLYQGLGRVQAFSAMAFSTFAVIHLVPPMLASVGGVELANKALLWGRVYYQTYGLEQVLVSGSLLVHLGAGLCKAVIRMVWKFKAYYNPSSKSHTGAMEGADDVDKKSSSLTTTNPSGAKTTITTTTTTPKTAGGGGGGGGSASAPGLFPYHRLAGWILTPMVIGHMNGMRLAPLEVLGDSSMVDYSFVTYLHRIGRSGPYVLLVGLLTYHMFGGGPVAFNMMLPKGSARRVKVQELLKSKRVRGIAAAVVTGIVMVGTGRIMFAEGAIPMSRIYLSLLDW